MKINVVRRVGCCIVASSACVFGGLVGCAQAKQPSLNTVAEQSGFTRTGRYDDVMAFLHDLDSRSRKVHLTSMGTTFEGRDIPLVIIADPPVTSAQEARDDERLLVFLFGDIHAGEVCGKEALQMLSRDLALKRHAPLLKHLIIAIAPIYNADGNERFGQDNRPGQNGPEEMGTRRNAQGLDLNRDYIKLEAPETRSLVRFLNEWDPAVIVDTHTTDGSHHRYTLTFQGPKHPAGDREVLSYVRDTMLPAVSTAFERVTSYRSFFYGNFADKHSKWVTYPAEPRYGVAYRGMRNRLAILTEAYAYATFEDRVKATQAFCLAILGYADEHHSEINELVSAADARTIEAGRVPAADDTIALRTEVQPFLEKITVLGFDEYDEAGRRVEPSDPRAYEVQFVNNFVPILSVQRPYAYLIPAELGAVVDKLKQHGIDVHELQSDRRINVQWYAIDSIAKAKREFEGHVLRSVDVTPVNGFTTARAGSFVVLTAQPLGTLACYLLEPQSSDGLLAWNFMDAYIEPGARYPIMRVQMPIDIE